MKLFLPVEIICQQLDNTWQYFTTAFKVQVARRITQFSLFFSYNHKIFSLSITLPSLCNIFSCFCILMILNFENFASRYLVWSTNTTFQDRLYLQYVELNAFQNEFRELSNKFKENERIIQKLEIIGTSLAEVNAELDNLETVTKALSVDVYKAKKLAKTGETLMLGKKKFST